MPHGNGGEEGDEPRGPGPAPVLDNVRARRFELVDESGTVRAILGTQPEHGAPGFLVSDGQGRPRIAIHVTPDDSPSLDLLDPSGTPRLHVGLDAAGAPSVTLFGGAPRAAQALFSVTEEGSALLRLAQPDGKTRLFCSIQPDGTPYLSLMDRDGQPKLSLALPSGNPALLMLDRGGKPRAVVSVTTDEGPQFAILGEDGSVSWTSRPAAAPRNGQTD